MRYAQKPVVFDTVLVSRIPLAQHPFTAFSEMPDWLHNALAKGTVRPVGSRTQNDDPFWGFELTQNGPFGTAWPQDVIAQLQIDDGLIGGQFEVGDLIIIRPSNLATYYERIFMPTTPDEAPIGHPEPPHETALGSDSTPAPEMAEVAEDQLEAEEVATDE